MSNNCEFTGDRCCLCSACQAVRKVMEEAEMITKEEVDKLFHEAEELLKNQGDDAKGRIWP